MGKVKLTKNELKTQKDSLKRFNRYLPTLKLKKKQLQVEIGRIRHKMHELTVEIKQTENSVLQWVDVFAEEVGLDELIKLKEIKTDIGNIAGIDIPLFLDVELQEQPYDFLLTPLWVDAAVEACRELIKLKARWLVVRRQRDILQEELRITIQRVNLFEKVKIPEARESIRVINIYLGDQQTAEVVRGKIAKAKIEKKKEAIPA